MIRSVVVPDGSVSTTCGYIQKIVEGILEKIALEVDAEGILRRLRLAVKAVRPSFKHNFAKKLELVGDVRGDEQIELPQRKGSCIALHGVAMEGNVSESANAQKGLAQVHSVGHGIVGRGWLGLRGSSQMTMVWGVARRLPRKMA